MSKTANLVRTIRLDDAAIEEIVAKLSECKNPPGSEKRKHQRYPYSVKGCVLHIQGQGGGAGMSYVIPTKDISDSGMSFLHGSFIYPGTKCVIQLIAMHGTWQNVPAEIVRCKYISNGVHDVGVRFSEMIDASRFCPEAAPCRTLVVDDNNVITRLTEMLLKGMNAKIDTADNGATAIELASSNVYDVIFMDIDMPDMDGFETVKRLRDKGYSGKIVAATGMTQPGDKKKCLAAGFDAYLPKPFDREQLAQLLKSLRQEPLLSSLSEDKAMLPLIEAFVMELPARVRQVESAFAGKDMNLLQSACRNLKGEAGGFGFEPISSAASMVELATIEKADDGKVKKLVEDLVKLCCQARATTHAT